MRRHRRHEDDVRLELTPLIDVVFLLLTFFIFSLVVMVRANLLPVELVGVGTDLGTGSEAAVQAVTVDRDGRYFFNQQPMSEEQLVAALQTLAQRPDPPRVYVGIEDGGTVDRGPTLIRLMELLRAAGVSNIAFVGPPSGP